MIWLLAGAVLCLQDPTIRLAPAVAEEGSLTVAGEAPLPDRSRVRVWIHYGSPEPGTHLDYRTVEVQDGKLLASFKPFPGRPVPGRYSFVAVYEPSRQPAGLPTAAAARTESFLHVGDAKALEEFREAIRREIRGRLEGLDTLRSDIAGDPEPMKRMPEWSQRFARLRDAFKERADLRILGIHLRLESAFEELGQILWLRVRREPGITAEALDRAFEHRMKRVRDIGVPAPAKPAGSAMAEKARGFLERLSEDAPLREREGIAREFDAHLMGLAGSVPPSAYEAFVAFAAAARGAFAAWKSGPVSEEQREKSRETLAEFERRVRAVVEAPSPVRRR